MDQIMEHPLHGYLDLVLALDHHITLALALAHALVLAHAFLSPLTSPMLLYCVLTVLLNLTFISPHLCPCPHMMVRRNFLCK